MKRRKNQNPKSQANKKCLVSVLSLAFLCDKIYIKIIRKMKNYIVFLVNRVPES